MKVYVVVDSEFEEFKGLRDRTVVAVFSTAEKAHTTLQDSSAYEYYKYNREKDLYEDYSQIRDGAFFEVEVEEHWMEGVIV